MTTETLTELKRQYRAGTIAKSDGERLIAELLDRSDRFEEAKDRLKERAAEIVQDFTAALDG